MKLQVLQFLSSRKQRIMAEEEGRDSEDNISRLPDAILTAILSGLPLKHAVRTSVLSKRWRHLWNSIPHLQLNETLIFNRFDENNPRLTGSLLQVQLDESLLLNNNNIYYSRLESRAPKWLAIVCSLLFRRKDPIKSCLISFPFLHRYPLYIDVFLFFLSKIGVEELHLFNNEQHPYCIPSHFFFFKSLVFLMLKGCRILEIPRHFRGFTHLKTLIFLQVVSDNDTFEKVISSCPALEWVILFRCLGMTQVGIHNPNLKMLQNFTTRPMHFLLKDASRLEEARLSFVNFYFFDDYFEDDDESDARKFASFLGGLSTTQLQRLYISVCRRFAKHLIKDNFLDCLPENYQFYNLKVLSVDLEFIDEKVLPFLSFLLRRCPRLQQLFLEFTGDLKPVGAYALHDYWDKEGPLECVMNSLETVEMDSVDLNCEYEIGFARYLLLNANVLKTMKITCNKSKDKEPRVSTRACSTGRRQSFSQPRSFMSDSSYPSNEKLRGRKPRVLKELLHLQRASSDAQLTITFGMT